MAVHAAQNICGISDSHNISGKLLEAAFKCNIKKDSKSLVDKVFIKSPEEIDVLVHDMTFEDERAFWDFVDTVSMDRSTDFDFINKKKRAYLFNDSPAYVDKLYVGVIEDEDERRKIDNLQRVAKILNNAWEDIYVEQLPMSENIYSTMLFLPNAFIIPGDRFRECYYWDSYWTIEGLLNTGMYKTAVGMVENFIYLIETYGFIPNGTRTYYLNRSQPPYFPMMLLALYRHVPFKDVKDVLEKGIRAAEKEHAFFMNHRKITVRKGGRPYVLNIYKVDTSTPRPESYTEDKILAMEREPGTEQELWSDIKSAAESGWDFSTRWMDGQKTDLGTTRTSKIIPTDLNAIMYANELIISRLSEMLGSSEDAYRFKRKADMRLKAINTILWNPDEGIWNDYDYVREKHTSSGFYVSNLVPMCYGISPPTESITVYDILGKFSKEIFGREGGMPASGENNKESNQQWDYPNVWPPLVHIMTFFLERIGEREMALHMARTLIEHISVSTTVEDEKLRGIFEKYDCERTGQSGYKGEYSPQKGFGWTNGVAIHFLNEFSTDLMTNKSHTESYKNVIDLISKKIESREVPRHHTPEKCLLLDNKLPSYPPLNSEIVIQEPATKSIKVG